MGQTLSGDLSEAFLRQLVPIFQLTIHLLFHLFVIGQEYQVSLL